MTQSPIPIRAAVCHDMTETPYTRLGDGPTLVLVAADAEVRGSLMRALSRRFRVIAPELPDTFESIGSTFATWLRGFLDALGTGRVTLVADDRFRAAAIAFAGIYEDVTLSEELLAEVGVR